LASLVRVEWFHGSAQVLFAAWLVSCGTNGDQRASASGGAGGLEISAGASSDFGGRSPESGRGGGAGMLAALGGGTSGADAGASDAGSDASTGGASGAGALAFAGSGGSGDTGASGGAPAGGTAAAAGTGSAGEITPFDIDCRLASEFDPQAPGTVGIVTFRADAEPFERAELEFGLTTDYGMTAPVELAAADHRTLLLGMKAGRTYHFRVVAVSGSTTYYSADHTLDTGPAPKLPVTSYDVLAPDKLARGFLVTSFWNGSSSQIPFILDADGEVVWWYLGGPKGIARARLSADAKSMWLVVASNQGGPVQRVSLDTLDAETYPDTVGSHDITPVEGDLMAYLDYGEGDCASIFEIDPTGTTREVFESTDYVNPTGCHGNAVRYSAAEDVYTYSDFDQDVLVVNRAGGVEWRLSELVAGGNAAWGLRSHGHQLLDNGFLLFANLGATDGTSSAAIEYAFDGSEIMRYENGIAGPHMGDAQRLPGGNTLIAFSEASVIREIDPSGNVVLEIDGSSNFGYLAWVPDLYGPPSDIFQ